MWLWFEKFHSKEFLSFTCSLIALIRYTRKHLPYWAYAQNEFYYFDTDIHAARWRIRESSISLHNLHWIDKRHPVVLGILKLSFSFRFPRRRKRVFTVGKKEKWHNTRLHMLLYTHAKLHELNGIDHLVIKFYDKIFFQTFV